MESQLVMLQGYSCQLIVDEAIHWMDARKSKDQPFFINLWFHEPHFPLAAPDELTAHYGEGRDAIYSATIDNTDRAIKRLLKRLKELGVMDDTLIIYSSDNGSYMAGRNGTLRGVKGQNWEGGLRVPGIFVWPGKIPAGRAVEGPAGVVDILPTLCGLLGIGKPEVVLDGVDLASVLLSNVNSFKRQRPMFWHLQKSRPIVALRDGAYTLLAEPRL